MYRHILTSFAALAALVNAATVRVDVGQDGLVFTPSSVTAAMGDIVEYHFHPPNHSVVMGNFAKPCSPASTGGFFSGFFNTASGENSNVFQVTINTTDPIFFYCGFPTHCESGMSGVINPSSSQTLAMYQSNANGVQNTVVPPAVFGGVVGPASSSGASATPSPTPPASGGGGIYGGSGGSGAVSLGVSLFAVLMAVGLAV